MTEADRRPLVVVFPPSWTPPGGPDYSSFFDGLDVSWMHLTSLADATQVAAQPLSADRFVYPTWQLNHEVQEDAFAAIDRLTDAATRLQSVLADDSGLAARVRVEAFGNVSYFAREDDIRSLVATQGATDWLQEMLGSVTISAPTRVIMSSDSGRFSVTITNGLDEPVRLRLRTSSSPPMDISNPGELNLKANGATTVLLHASADTLGVHNVTISLADPDGRPIGSFDTVPVRAAQVSRVIWLILGLAGGLLLVAIVLRVVRRIRGGGGGPSGRDDDDPDPPAGGGPASAAAREPEPAATS
jgi:hypothetical protein